MGVEKYILVARRGLGHEAVPVSLEVLEGVMDAGCVVTASACHCLVTGLIKAFDLVEVQGATKRFVEELDCGDDVSVARVALSKILKRGDRLANGIA